MSKFLKNDLSFVNRTGHWVKNRRNYLTMERNERVDEFSKSLMKTLKKNITSFDLRTYPDDINKIYSIIAKWQKINPSQIILTDGADGGLLRIFSIFSKKNDKVFYLNPSYAMYPIYCKIFKLKSIQFNISPHEKKEDILINILNIVINKKPKIIAIANPNQPVELFLNNKDLIQILNISKKIGSLVVIDEAYYHFSNFTAKNLIKRYDNLIVVRTFSKAFGLAGLRIGYSMSSKSIIDSMKIIKPIYEINNLNIKICEFFIKNINFMNQNVKDINKSRIFFHKEMKKISIPSFGNYSNTVLIEIKNKKLMNKIFSHLYKNKIIVKPSIFFDKFYLRCTLGSLKPTKKLIKLIKESLN